MIDGDCTLTSTHPGRSIRRSHDLLYNERTESDWLKQCAAIIHKVSPLLELYPSLTIFAENDAFLDRPFLEFYLIAIHVF